MRGDVLYVILKEIIMAIFRSSLFGDLSKSLHNLVMYRSRGLSIVRSKPMTIHNPKTEKQRASRAVFRATTQLSAYLSPLTVYGFPSLYKTDSRNAFVSANMQMFSVDEEMNAVPDYRLMACSCGVQTPPTMKAVWAEDGRGVCVESFAQNISATASRQDMLYVVVFHAKDKDCDLHKFGERGMVQQRNFALNARWIRNFVYVYAFAVSANGNRASETLFLLKDEG